MFYATTAFDIPTICFPIVRHHTGIRDRLVSPGKRYTGHLRFNPHALIAHYLGVNIALVLLKPIIWENMFFNSECLDR